MSTICGELYEEEIDEIASLIEQHLDKYGKEDMPGAIERIFAAFEWGMKYKLKLK